MSAPAKTLQELEKEIERLRRRLEDADATIHAIRHNEVDAFLVEKDSEEQVLVLDGVDRPYRLLIERMQQGAITISSDFTIVYLNSRFAEMVDSSASSLISSNLCDYVVDSDRSALMSLVNGEGTPDSEQELQLQRPDGSTLPVHMTVSPLVEKTGIYCLIVTDLTQQKRHEAERKNLIQAKAATAAAEASAAILLEADRRKDEFLAMLAHELRTPLAPLRSGVEILNRISSNEEQVQKTRDMMTRQIESLVRLVDDLLDVSRVTHGKITLQKERADLGEIVARAVESARTLVQERGHQLRVDTPKNGLPVEVDVIRLAQAVTNLLSNAAKFTPNGGTISLTVEKEEEHALIRVRDDGIGVAPEMLPKVFQLFMQADPSAGRTEGGLGIGLTLATRLVEMHGGSLQAFSRGIGEGSEFVLRLPLLLENEGNGSGVAAAAKVKKSSSMPRRILVVDDHRDAAESLALLLRLQGHEVKEVYDGPEALAVAADFGAEVIFLDIGLPGMNGYEVAKHMRSDSRLRGVRLIALSGYGSEEHRQQCSAVGFDGLLVKPVQLATLESVLTAMPALFEREQA